MNDPFLQILVPAVGLVAGLIAAYVSLKNRALLAEVRKEIAEAEAALRAGHPDIEGLCLALADWSSELRLIVGRPDSR